VASEFDIIRKYFTREAPTAVLGVGDDCALLRPDPGMLLAVSTDMLTAGIHFFPGAELAWDKLPRAAPIADCTDKALAEDCLLAGGDDYELVFTASKLKRAQIEAAGRDLEIPLALIGAAVPGDPVARLRDARGKLVSRPRKGFDHFA